MFKVEGLYKTFEAHSANEVHAINGVDLVINDGDFITVIGSNGAGKSLLYGGLYCAIFFIKQ